MRRAALLVRHVTEHGSFALQCKASPSSSFTSTKRSEYHRRVLRQPGASETRQPMFEKVAYTVRMRPICFISDYGLTDVLVGTCHGVMEGIAPGATIIDVSHTVPGFDIIRGAEVLWHATRYMPEDSVYLTVVDPGDKTKRREIAVEVRGGAYLVGPDNGILLPAAEALGGIVRAVQLTNPRYHVHPVSSAFHGR